MKLTPGFSLNELTEENLRYALQLGVTHVIVESPRLGERGAGRILTSHEGLKRLIEAVPSPCNGLEFCQGTVAEMGPDRAIEAIRYFAGLKKIFYVHFRNVRGRFPKFDEVFIDEGDVDALAAMRAYKAAGFDGVMTPDHSPRVAGDTPFRHRGMAFALGYMKAMMQVVEREP